MKAAPLRKVRFVRVDRDGNIVRDGGVGFVIHPDDLPVHGPPVEKPKKGKAMPIIKARAIKFKRIVSGKKAACFFCPDITNQTLIEESGGRQLYICQSCWPLVKAATT